MAIISRPPHRKEAPSSASSESNILRPIEAPRAAAAAPAATAAARMGANDRHSGRKDRTTATAAPQIAPTVNALPGEGDWMTVFMALLFVITAPESFHPPPADGTFIAAFLGITRGTG